MLTLRALLSNPTEQAANLVGVVLTVAGCVIDFVTGSDYSPVLFYMPAAIYTAWLCGTGIGRACMAVISVSILVVNFGSSVERVGIEAASFNAATRIATVLFVYWIIRRLHHQMQALRQINERLKETDRQKDKLLGAISHDLRSPFNAVLAYSEMLERSAEGMSEKTRQYARDCHDAARSAYDLLDHLLRWAQLQMKRIEMHPALFEASALVRRCIQTHQAAADLKEIALTEQTINPTPTCFADFAAAETVLRNLINNAIKFTPSGGSIVVGVTSDSNSVEFFVRDSGVGIARDNVDRLFTLLTSSVAGTQGERGIGLGLAMCRDLAVQCNGAIRAESTPGEGSCFWFRLPKGSGDPS